MDRIHSLANRGMTWIGSSQAWEQTKKKAHAVAKEAFEAIACLALGAGIIVVAIGGGLFAWKDPIAFGCFGVCCVLAYNYFEEQCQAIFKKVFGWFIEDQELPLNPKVSHFTGCGLFRPSILQQNPPFIPGSPPRLQNGGATCFMNAAFQAVLNDPVLKKDLGDSVSLWIERYRDLETLCNYLENTTNALVPYTSTNKSSHNLTPSVLALFAHDDFYDIRTNLLDNLPDIKVSLGALISKMQHKEPFDPYVLFQDRTQLENTLDYFLKIKDNILEAAKRNENKKRAFIKLSEILKKCSAQDPSQHVICLSILRPLLPINHQYGQQDAMDFIHALIHPIAESGIKSSFLFNLTHEKHYVELKDIKGDDNDKATRIAQSNDPSELPENGILKETTKNFGFIIPIKPTDNPGGQELLDAFLNRNPPAEESDPSCWIDNDEKKLYIVGNEQVTLESPPGRFLISLNRGIGGRKNNTPVIMPETLTIMGTTYQMHSAVIHQGGARGGHYISFVRKIEDGKATWWRCDDSCITLATEDALETAFSQGSFYLFSRPLA